MSRHEAEIRWRREGDFSANAYSRRHHWSFDGGAVVVASSSPSVVSEPHSDPAGVDPEEALVASVSSCHMLWFLDLARQGGWRVESYSDRAVGTMGRIAPGRMALTEIVLHPRIAFEGAAPAPDALAELHEAAHQRCFIANSLLTKIRVEPA